MSFFSDLTDKFKKAARSVVNGASGFLGGMVEGTTKGNSIGTLIGMVGCGIAAILLGGLTFPAIITGITVGGLCGVIGGAIVGSFRGAAQKGASLEEAEPNMASPASPAQGKAPAPSITIPQTTPAKPASQDPAPAVTNLMPAASQGTDVSTKFRDRHTPPASDVTEQRQPAISR